MEREEPGDENDDEGDGEQWRRCNDIKALVILKTRVLGIGDIVTNIIEFQVPAVIRHFESTW